MSKHPDPMLTSTLREMARRHTSGDARALLWEVYRLRNLIQRVDALAEEASTNSLPFNHEVEHLVRRLRVLIQDEPAVREATRPRAATRRETELERRQERG